VKPAQLSRSGTQALSVLEGVHLPRPRSGWVKPCLVIASACFSSSSKRLADRKQIKWLFFPDYSCQTGCQGALGTEVLMMPAGIQNVCPSWARFLGEELNLQKSWNHLMTGGDNCRLLGLRAPRREVLERELCALNYWAISPTFILFYFILLYFILFYLCVCVCVCVCVCTCTPLVRTRTQTHTQIHTHTHTHTHTHMPLQAIKRDNPGAGVRGGCEPPAVGAWNRTGILWKNRKCS
jgi:hypothetical protein